MTAVAEPGRSIAADVLGDMALNFRQGIDLMDETLREGAERATVPPSLQDKADLAEAIAATGVRTLVVGMFPDVPHNIALLKELVARQEAGRIPADVRFMIISHVGVTFEQTLQVLAEYGIATRSVWIIVIHSVSDQQIHHLFSTIVKKDASARWDDEEWNGLSHAARRQRNLDWLNGFLPTVSRYEGGGIMCGLLDAFRADHGHLMNACEVVTRHGIRQIRLVDTAGTCMPHQMARTVGDVVRAYPDVDFFGHFHDDFGMATSNAIVGLSMGMKGVDVSVGGFANRAGHPPLGEVAMALKKLYGVSLPGFQYERLSSLSRLVEKLYGLMENPAQAITGVITHSIQSGIRTELLKRAPTIFDVLDPGEVGSSLVRMFGVRSGRDGLLRFLKDTRLLQAHGVQASAEVADRLYPLLEQEWRRRSERAHEGLRESIDRYHAVLQQSFFTEQDVRVWLEANSGLFKKASEDPHMSVHSNSQAKLHTALREISVDSSEEQWSALLALTASACQAAFPAQGRAERDALTDVHRALYTLYVQRNAVPWDEGWKNIDDSRFVRVREMIEAAWSADEARRFADRLSDMPSAQAFPQWAEAICQADASNVTHPLFSFLCNDASKAQLQEFLFQETPFDIHFGDLLAMMLPGVYGGAKAELSKNFWDEMGHGVPVAMHRELRLQMTRKLGIKDELYLDAERFCTEELQLANMYFHTVTNRALLPQAIGMMLATELMVPGRLDQQIMGWRRVGLPDADMTYLLEHVVVDVEHAHGWMNNVVIPLLAKRPRLMSDLALGMFRRLAYAQAVCDHMIGYLPSVESFQQAA